MKMLPRYQFRGRGPGCGQDGHTDDCLCDVHVTEPAPINTDCTHLWWDRALDEVGDEWITPRNFVEVASIALGMHTIYLREVADPATIPGALRYERLNLDIGPAAFRRFPDEIKLAVRRHYMVGSPWRIAQLEFEHVPLERSEFVEIREFYSRLKHSSQVDAAERALRPPRQWGQGVCQHCGETFEKRHKLAVFCGMTCRKRAGRARQKAAGENQ